MGRQMTSADRVCLLVYRVDTTGRWLVSILAARLAALDNLTRSALCHYIRLPITSSARLLADDMNDTEQAFILCSGLFCLPLKSDNKSATDD
jgi:hypothetical protein